MRRGFFYALYLCMHLMRGLLAALTLTLLSGCVDPVTPEYDYRTGFLLVEGTIGGEGQRSEVRISRSELSFGQYRLREEVGAQVSSIDGGGTVTEWFATDTKGTYRPDTSFVGRSGESYRIRILTREGEIVESEAEPMPRSIAMDTLRMTYQQEAYFSTGRDRFVPAFTMLIDVTDPVEEDNFFRYRSTNWSSTQICETCFNSVYRDGRCVQRNGVDFYDYLCNVPCWRVIRTDDIYLLSDELNPGGSYTDVPAARIDRINSGALLVEVEQQSLNRLAYLYFREVEDLTEGSSGLNAPLPAALYGNLRDLSENETSVLGYVAAVASSSRRIFFNRDTVPGEPLFIRSSPRLEPLSPSPPPAPCEGPGLTPERPEGWRF